jgi:hypothetical protein
VVPISFANHLRLIAHTTGPPRPSRTSPPRSSQSARTTSSSSHACASFHIALQCVSVWLRIEGEGAHGQLAMHGEDLAADAQQRPVRARARRDHRRVEVHNLAVELEELRPLRVEQLCPLLISIHPSRHGGRARLRMCMLSALPCTRNAELPWARSVTA